MIDSVVQEIIKHSLHPSHNTEPCDWDAAAEPELGTLPGGPTRSLEEEMATHQHELQTDQAVSSVCNVYGYGLAVDHPTSQALHLIGYIRTSALVVSYRIPICGPGSSEGRVCLFKASQGHRAGRHWSQPRSVLVGAELNHLVSPALDSSASHLSRHRPPAAALR